MEMVGMEVKKRKRKTRPRASRFSVLTTGFGCATAHLSSSCGRPELIVTRLKLTVRKMRVRLTSS